MKTIELHDGTPCLVDDDDYELVNRHSWFHTAWGYAGRTQMIDDGGKRRMTSLRLHRIIMKAPRGVEVDHINCDKLDNRKQNLRFVTKQQNIWNMPPKVTSTTGIKGVGWYEKLSKYQARIPHNGKTVHLGYFTSWVDARDAYNAKARELRGEYAYTS